MQFEKGGTILKSRELKATEVAEHSLMPNPALTVELLRQRSAFIRFLSAKVGAEAAEDILQSCYLKVIEKGSEIRKDESLVSWFYTVLRHAIVDYYRRNAVRNRVHVQFSADSPISYENELKSNLCECLPGVLKTLKDDYQVALQEVDFDGHSIAEYAKSQGTTTNNASVRLHRARKAAAKRLSQVCGACAEHKCLDCTCRSHKV